jgi:dihydroorotate dehydrogenase
VNVDKLNMYRLLRPLLFRLDPETAHTLTLYALRFTGAISPLNWAISRAFYTPPKPVQAFGLTFRNPVGLAAGYDKDGIAVRGLAALGFGHIEIGTVTPRPQAGNPKPRVFRLVEDQAVINRMGFPGKGAEFVEQQLKAYVIARRSACASAALAWPPGQAGTGVRSVAEPKTDEAISSQQGIVHLHLQQVQVSPPPSTTFPGLAPPVPASGACRAGRAAARNDMRVMVGQSPTIIVGVNLGMNKDTPLENAAEDYLSLMRTFAPLADYLAINVSSPNTVGLRRLQGREMLENLLEAVAETRNSLALPAPVPQAQVSKAEGLLVTRPILVKIAPDLSDEELDDAIGAILDTGMDGVIATNTTLGRQGLRSKRREETGGLSGSPLTVRSEAVLRGVVKRVEGRIPVVSVGGIMCPEDAKRRLDMGAALVQVYTGLIYAGPGLVQKIIQAV